MKTQYFGESGLTSTSANYICNLAKESYEKLESKLNATSFLEEYITIIGAKAETRVSLASKELLNTAPVMLKEIYNLKSLIAWLREAIKEKENLFKANRLYESTEYTTLIANRPIRKEYLTEQEVVASWTVKEQEEYLSLETRCAVIGKYIHPNGPLSRAKKDLSFRLSHPIVTECSGRDTIVRRYQAVTTEEEVDALFFSLQNKHRELQAQLNGIKHKIEVALHEDMQKKDEEYRLELEVYHTKIAELRESDKLTRIAKDKEIEALKIIIPNDLKATYDSLAKLGK